MSLKQFIYSDKHFFELLKGSSIAVLFRGYGILAGYILNFVLALYFSAEGVGIYAILWTMIVIASVISKLGFDTAIVRFIASYVSEKKWQNIPKIYTVAIKHTVFSGIVVSAIVIFLAPFFSHTFFDNSPNYLFIILITLGILPLSILQINAETIRGLKKVGMYSALQNGTINTIIILAIVISHFVFPDRIIIPIAIVIALYVVMIFSFFPLTKNIKALPKVPHIINKHKKVLHITIPMLFSSSLFMVMNWTDTLMLSYFMQESIVGVYNTALKIASLNSVVLIAINTIAMPKYAELFKSDKKRFKFFIKQTTTLIFTISLPIVIVLMLFPEFLLSIFGEDFIIGKTALFILAFGQFISSISGSTINILNMTGNEKTAQFILLFSTTINFVLNAILIPQYGLIGAAIATAFTMVLWNVLAVIAIYRKYKFLTYPSLNLFVKQIKNIFQKEVDKC